MVYEQVRLRPACTVTEDGQWLEILDLEEFYYPCRENKGADQLRRLLICLMAYITLISWERGGVVVELRTLNREVLGSILTGVTVLCP